MQHAHTPGSTVPACPTGGALVHTGPVCCAQDAPPARTTRRCVNRAACSSSGWGARAPVRPAARAPPCPAPYAAPRAPADRALPRTGIACAHTPFSSCPERSEGLSLSLSLSLAYTRAFALVVPWHVPSSSGARP
ncbi:hypothetical protein JK165_12800 [Acetobacter okinawensis]|uniref:hypothetical protein n=1 Tax=Acetobacter okinawensis TaxID=1076594 RepID=UPI001BAB78D6|nr:hypothetical protein [Acetobacter okinawensis]MBS0966953.1 hypothetical protein [Acetobacter okinawensis]